MNEVYKGARRCLGELHTSYLTVAVKTAASNTGSGHKLTTVVSSYDAAEDIIHIADDTRSSPGDKAVITAEGSIKTKMASDNEDKV